MAAVASPPKQDVGYQTTYQQQQQESPTCDDAQTEQCIKRNSSKFSNESQEPIEEVASGSGETKKFTLGIDDGSEFMDEVSFALQHCAQPLHQPRQGIGDSDDAEAGQIVVGQPPPGHWVSQPHGRYLYQLHYHA